MSIKSLTRLVTGAISIPLLILFSHEGLQAQTDSECDRYARETAEREEGGVIRKGVEGAAKGAIIGAIFGDAGDGARAGATIGGISGGVTKKSRREEAYNEDYQDCMNNQG
ncbi:MAG: glycine zipper family protein [Xenococcaceae cyanobacterium]